MVKAKTATPQVAVSSSITHWEAIRQALLRLEREGYSPRLLPVLEEVGVGPELPPLWWERLSRAWIPWRLLASGLAFSTPTTTPRKESG